MFAKNNSVKVFSSDVIYELIKSVDEHIEEVSEPEVIGRMEILATFGHKDDKQVIGGKVIEGSINLGRKVEIRRRNIIVRKLSEYFEYSNNLILDGFVNFRLKEYIKDLEDIVDRAVDDFLMEREYKEFIRLLRYFVEIQSPKYDTIHIIIEYDGKYTVLDEMKNEITNECIDEFINEIPEEEINYDDLLVSSLITFAPKKIVIHSKGQLKNKELLETIKNVFSDKVSFCSGCEMCILNRENHDKN